MKKLLSLTLAMAMVLSLSLASASADNSDLDIVPQESAVQPRADLCPECRYGHMRFVERYVSSRVMVGRISCQCERLHGEDGIFQVTTVTVYECNNSTCGIGSIQTDVTRETAHLN